MIKWKRNVKFGNRTSVKFENWTSLMEKKETVDILNCKDNVLSQKKYKISISCTVKTSNLIMDLFS